MPTVKFDNTTLWGSSNKVTTPSMIIDGNFYIPLLSGNANTEIQSGTYHYHTIGNLLIDGKRPVDYRCYKKTISGTLSGTITGTKTTTKQETVSTSASASTSWGGTYQRSSAQKQTTKVTVQAIGTVESIISVSGSYDSYSFSGNNITINFTVTQSGPYGSSSYEDHSGTVKYTYSTTTTKTVTVGTNETKSITPTQTQNYGVTYPSAPTISNVTSDVTVTNQSDNAKAVAKTTLSGDVAYQNTVTLSKAYSFNIWGKM